MKQIQMSMKDFVAEHKKLINILKSGNKKAQEKEAMNQMKELIKQRLNEVALTKSDVKDEVSNQLDSNPIKKKIEDIVSAKIKAFLF